MTPAELALTAALGSSALTGAASMGVIWVREWRRRKANDRDALRAAATDLLSRSMAVAMRAKTMGEMMKFRSGLKEGWDVALRHRKPADALELHDWMAQDLVPLNAALSELWTRADQEGAQLANDVVSKCMDLLGASTARQPADGGWERVRRWAVGDRWTPEMIAENDRAMRALALARKRFADHARARLGHQAIELFVPMESPEVKTEPDTPAVVPMDEAGAVEASSALP
jgi:hypothetical protein